MEIVTHSEKETFSTGKKFASQLSGGELIGLVGNLGAGKTVFSKGVAAGLGVKETVNSPTFVFMKIYRARKRGIKTLIHVDAYRIKKQEELKNIGLEEYVRKKENVVLIEWADKINMPGIKNVIFEILDNSRRIKY